MNAAMEDRTTIEWDKDDLDALGILKIDVLALGMLTALSKGFALLDKHYGRASDARHRSARGGLRLCDDPARRHDRRVPDREPRADVDAAAAEAGEVLRSRHRGRDRAARARSRATWCIPICAAGRGWRRSSIPPRELEAVLGKTLGVPLFQEQAMKIAIVAAGFTPGEADKLRRAMATFRRVGTIQTFQTKMVEGMAAKGYEREFAERCFRQIEGFGEYGFPESHAASFALLVYASCWMKCRYPDVFLAAMLNSQPLGFYAPSQLVRDAREHGVEVREVDVNFSDWDCTLEAEAPHPRRLSARGERIAPPATPRWPSTSARPMPCGSACARSSARARRRCASSSSARRGLRFRARSLAARRRLARRARDARRRRRVPLARPRPARGAVGGARAQPRRRPGRSAAVRAPTGPSATPSPTPSCRRCRWARMWSRITGGCRCR